MTTIKITWTNLRIRLADGGRQNEAAQQSIAADVGNVSHMLQKHHANNPPPKNNNKEDPLRCCAIIQVFKPHLWSLRTMLKKTPRRSEMGEFVFRNFHPSNPRPPLVSDLDDDDDDD